MKDINSCRYCDIKLYEFLSPWIFSLEPVTKQVTWCPKCGQTWVCLRGANQEELAVWEIKENRKEDRYGTIERIIASDYKIQATQEDATAYRVATIDNVGLTYDDVELSEIIV